MAVPLLAATAIIWRGHAERMNLDQALAELRVATSDDERRNAIATVFMRCNEAIVELHRQETAGGVSAKHAVNAISRLHEATAR